MNGNGGGGVLRVEGGEEKKIILCELKVMNDDAIPSYAREFECVYDSNALHGSGTTNMA